MVSTTGELNKVPKDIDVSGTKNSPIEIKTTRHFLNFYSILKITAWRLYAVKNKCKAV